MAWAALGGAYSLKGSFLSISDLVRKGVEMERRAVALDPKLADAHSWLGGALLTLGQVDEAIAAVNEAIRLEPENGQAYQALGRAYWAGKGDFAAAIPAFRRGSSSTRGRLFARCSSACCSRGKANTTRRRQSAAAPSSSRINTSRAMPGYRSWANARLGYVFYLQGRYEEAIREHERGWPLSGRAITRSRSARASRSR
jgi:tetratricopeptide (TPR) repeat protein